MKISVSSYSFQQKLDSRELTQFDCIAKAKEMGFDAIEFEGMEDCCTGLRIGLANLRRFIGEA